MNFRMRFLDLPTMSKIGVFSPMLPGIFNFPSQTAKLSAFANKTVRSNRECRLVRTKRGKVAKVATEREVQNTLRNPRAYFKPIIRLTLNPSRDFFQTESFLVTGLCHEDHVNWKDVRCPMMS